MQLRITRGRLPAPLWSMPPWPSHLSAPSSRAPPPPSVTPTFLLAQLLDSTDVNVVVDGGAGELGGGVDLQCRGVWGGGEGV